MVLLGDVLKRHGGFFGGFAVVTGAKDAEGQGSDDVFLDTLCLTEIEIIAFYSACHDGERVGI